MKHQPRRRASLGGRGLPFKSLVVAIGLLSVLQEIGATPAIGASESPRWQAERVLQFSARVDYTGTHGHVTRRDATVGTMHLRLKSPARPVTVGLMLEYSAIDQRADTFLVAGMLTRKVSNWTVSASPYYVRTAQRAAGDWRYWGSVRRHITPRQSVGVELFGSLETGRPRKWMLGYSATITETLSISVSAGSAFDVGPDWLARTSLTWRPRSGRR